MTQQILQYLTSDMVIGIVAVSVAALGVAMVVTWVIDQFSGADE